MRKALKTGNWNKAPKAYELVSEELACIGQVVVLRGTRIVIPRKLRRRVWDLDHEGHKGIVKTKECLRSQVWWPGIDIEAEKRCRECFGCQLVSKNVPTLPVKPTRLPGKIDWLNPQDCLEPGKRLQFICWVPYPLKSIHWCWPIILQDGWKSSTNAQAAILHGMVCQLA